MADVSLIIGAWVAVGLTLFIFSFLYRDNPLFKIAEHLYLGAGMGWVFQQTYYSVWVPKVYEPLISNDFSPLIPTILGLSLTAQFIPKISWISRYGFTFIMGYGSGLAIPVTIATTFVAQIEGTIQPLVKMGTGGVVLTGPALWGGG